MNDLQDTFVRNVFINCPFDQKFAPILEAISFCVIRFNLIPRLASDVIDGADTRIDKILMLIENSKYSIHDLSRCQATEIGEYSRMNMPFELGIDFGLRRLGSDHQQTKSILILDEKKYRVQVALSDLAGSDIASHNENFEQAVVQVRNWLVNQAKVQKDSPDEILNDYSDYQEWMWEDLRAQKFSDKSIRQLPTPERLAKMSEWFKLGKPVN